eukprot:EG_transcript_28112
MGLADWLYGPEDPNSKKAEQFFEDAVQSGIHITELKGQHFFHPYNPDMDAMHPCAEHNHKLLQCFEDDIKAQPEAPLRAHHVQCFLVKSELMVCLTKHKKAQRLQEAAAGPVAATPGDA